MFAGSDSNLWQPSVLRLCKLWIDELKESIAKNETMVYTKTELLTPCLGSQQQVSSLLRTKRLQARPTTPLAEEILAPERPVALISRLDS